MINLTKKEMQEVLWDSSICVVLVIGTLTFAYWTLATLTGVGYCV